MLEWLVKIPGPNFLALFILLSTICIIAGWRLLKGKDWGICFPDKNQIDMVSIAVLRGGWQAAVDVTVLQLMERNIIDFMDNSDGKVLQSKNHSAILSPVEQVIYEYLLIPKNYSQFHGKDIQIAMENALQPVYRRLQQGHLIKTAEELSRGKWITYSLLVFLDGLALIKIYFGVMYHKPVLFLMLLIPIVSFILFFVLKPWRKITSLGERYLKELTKHFDWLKTELVYNNGGSSEMSVALGAAIFGLGVLAYNERFSPYKSFAQSNSLNGAGSNSTTDVTGGDSGSSDGGGSGCSGGGCGGCGGGD